MPRRGRKKIKDLVDMLEDPEDAGYVGGDYEDIMEQLERELSNQEEEEEGQETEEE
ncbi:MAG TPA: hypothetical protein VNK81_02430 [Thermodesulfobacteriota bacterium]|jgi:hypothetical protein|nr:hypothetical protein [Thermodesulfobacteriota bacterium]